MIQLNLSAADLAQTTNILLSLLDAVNIKIPGKFQQHFLRSLLDALLYRITDLLYLHKDNRIANESSRSVQIARQFNRLVKENFQTLKKPSDYANLLHITSSHLNDTLKVVTGFTCTYLIQQELITEAQRLLFYTSKSIKEISNDLGYQDYKYFIRLFGKITKQSPIKFRRQAGIANS